MSEGEGSWCRGLRGVLNYFMALRTSVSNAKPLKPRRILGVEGMEQDMQSTTSLGMLQGLLSAFMP